MSTRLAVLLGATCLAAATPSLGASYRLSHTFVDPMGGANDYFGTAVAIEGGVVAIKSRSSIRDGDSLSRTHVFESRPTGKWSEVASYDFDSGAGQSNPFMGEELAIDGGVIAVGYGDFFSGSSLEPIQVLERGADGWERSFARLWLANQLPDPPRDSPFALAGVRPAGWSVGVSGDLIIASEFGVRPPGATVVNDISGVARVFERQSDGTWAEAANLFVPSDDRIGSRSIIAAHISGDIAVITYSFRGMTREATTHFFQRDLNGQWNSKESFVSDLGAVLFGRVRLDGEIAVARYVSPTIEQVDRTVIYERVGGVWLDSYAIEAVSSNANHQGFALEGDLLARTVGGVLDEPVEIEVFRRDGVGVWNLLTTIADPAPDSDLQFGWKLDIDQGRILVGARSVNAVSPGPGAAYLFVPVPEPGGLALLGFCLAAAGRSRPCR